MRGTSTSPKLGEIGDVGGKAEMAQSALAQANAMREQVMRMISAEPSQSKKNVMASSEYSSARGRDGVWAKFRFGGNDWSYADLSGDVNVHVHVKAADGATTRSRYFPGPGDHISAYFGKPSYFLTPDGNTLVEVGIKDHAYFAKRVWQRPGTDQKISDKEFAKWRPRGGD
jgi:hypothetical protein